MANVRAYFDFLTARGLSPVAAAGVLGNIEQESGFNPSAFNAKEGAEGLGQWRLDRRDAMRSHVAASSLPPALAQLDFMVQEMGPLRDRLNKARTPEDAAMLFGKEYERPKAVEPIRATNAKNLYAGLADPSYGGAKGMVAQRGTSDAAPMPWDKDRTVSLDEVRGAQEKGSATPNGAPSMPWDKDPVVSLPTPRQERRAENPVGSPPTFVDRMTEAARSQLDQVDAALQGTTPVQSAYGKPLGTLVPAEISETRTNEVWGPDGTMTRFDPAGMVAVRKEGTNDYQVFSRAADTNEGALARLGRLIGVGTIAGSNMPRPGGKYIPSPQQGILDAMKTVGIDPAVSDITNNRFIGGFLQLLRNSMLGGGVGAQAEKRVQQGAAALERIQGMVGGAKSVQTAGEALQEGAKYFVTKSPDLANVATMTTPSRDVGFFNKYQRFIDDTTGKANLDAIIDPVNTRGALDKITETFTNPVVGRSVVPGDLRSLTNGFPSPPPPPSPLELLARQAKEQPASGVWRNPNFVGDLGQMAPNTPPPPATSLGDLKALRTSQGEKLSGVKIAGANTAEGMTKQLYGSIKDDIGAEMARQGLSHEAHRADQLYAAGQKRIDVLRPILDAKSNEQAFERLWTAAREGANADLDMITAVTRSLPKEKMDAVRSGILGKMGQAKPGASDVNEGIRWSPATFTTNYVAMPDKAKTALFGEGTAVRTTLDALAKATSSQKRLERLANTSNSFNQALVYSQGAQVALGLGATYTTGSLWPLIGVVGTHLGAAGMGNLMMKPRFVNWLVGNSQTMPVTAAARKLSSLKAMAVNDPMIAQFEDALRRELESSVDE